MHPAKPAAKSAAAWLKVSANQPDSGAPSKLNTPDIRMPNAAGITSRFMPSAIGENRLKKYAVSGAVAIQAETDTSPNRVAASPPSRIRRRSDRSSSGNCHSSRRNRRTAAASNNGWSASNPATAVNDSRNPRSPSCAGAASRMAMAATASPEIASGRRRQNGAANIRTAMMPARTALVAAPVATT